MKIKIWNCWKTIKNQQLINLYDVATLFWTWFCLHVSQNKLSLSTPLFWHKLYFGPIKTNNFAKEIEQTKKSILDGSCTARDARNVHRKRNEGWKKIVTRLMASLHDGLMIMWCEIRWWISKVSIEKEYSFINTHSPQQRPIYLIRIRLNINKPNKLQNKLKHNALLRLFISYK